MPRLTASFTAYLTTCRRPLLSAAILIGFACAGGDESEFWSLFQPDAAATQADDRPYQFTPLLYNTDMFGFDEGVADDSLSRLANTNAWLDYVGRTAVNDEQMGLALADTTDTYGVAGKLDATKPDAATYLRFAYAAVNASAKGDQWNRIPADSARLTRLAADARQQAKAATDPFLKERYAFQAVKLAHESGQFDQSRAAYEQLVRPLTKRTFISDWARCRYAGALYRTGAEPQALFEFAQVFANCPSRRHAAERSLRMHNLRFMDEALAFAKTDAERVAVYAICAIQPKQDALPLLEKMVELDPKNRLNELVLAREINRNEYYTKQDRWNGYVEDQESQNDSVAFEKRRTTVANYNQELLAFTEKAAQNAALGNPAFYGTAAAYLHYLAGDYANAKTVLDEAAKQPIANKALKQQIALQQMLLLSAQPGQPDAATETNFISYLTQFYQNGQTRYDEGAAPYNFRFANAVSAAGSQMANRYLGTSAEEKRSGGWLSGCSSKKEAATMADGMPPSPLAAKAFLMRAIAAQVNAAGYYLNDQFALEDSTTAETARAVVDFVQKPGGEFDERLAKLAGFNAEAAYELAARRNIAEGNYEAAARAYAKIDPKTWSSDAFTSEFDVDPFTVNLPGEGKPRPRYSALQFVQRMAELQTKAKQAADANKTGDDVAKLTYELGCGAYNLSYWGNAWILNHRTRSSAEATNHPNDPYYTNSIARQYFEQAAKLAQSPELAAKATYMAVRCQYDAQFAAGAIQPIEDYEDEAARASKQLANAKAMREAISPFRQRYASTRFAQDLQSRCLTYREMVQ